MWVHLNDDLVPLEEARISVLDRGFLYGDGLFETLAAYDGVLFRAGAHLRRLAESAAYLAIPLPHGAAGLERRLHACLEKNGRRDAILRLSLSRGAAGPGLGTRAGVEPTLVILCLPPRRVPRRMFDEGAALVVAGRRRNAATALDPAAKTTNFLNNILAFREAEARGADEALMLNQEGELAEGTASNLFLVRGGELHTPELACGLMAGVTRAAVLEVARGLGIPCREARLPLAALAGAEEVFYTNTSATVMPVAHVDNRRYPAPGPVTLRLRQGLHRLIEREAGPCWAVPPGP